MEPLAELLLRSGGSVTGCDLRQGPWSRKLEDLGATIWTGHDPDHVEKASALVITSAVAADHPELVRAQERGIPVLKRAQALGIWVNRGTLVAIAGTHGKTTTTAMVTQILSDAGMDPTGLVGGHVSGWQGNLRHGRDDLFVVEADEYDRSFHTLRPTVAVVTNLEADHLDVYGDLEGVTEAFRIFVGSVAEDGWVVVCGDDHGASRLVGGLDGRGFTYGLNPGNQLRGVEVTWDGEDVRFQVEENGQPVGEIQLGSPGLHNVRNALAAAATARHLGVEWDAIRFGLARFQGVGRRLESVGTVDGVLVMDDYAHHPTEVRATLAAVRQAFPDRRIVAVFQPHLFTRTRDFASEFGAALSDADEIWVTEVYPAREEPIPGVSGELVADAAREAGAEGVNYHPDLEGLPATLAGSLQPGDLCLTLGAGSIETVGSALVTALQEAGHG
jgi:UDP-N-acetylmuramate--alanine ligase